LGERQLKSQNWTTANKQKLWMAGNSVLEPGVLLRWAFSGKDGGTILIVRTLRYHFHKIMGARHETKTNFSADGEFA
jgi:hypothetical protein